MYRVDMSWLYGNVRPYFEQRGINLLKDDMLFIVNCLSNIPPDRHRFVMRDYLNIWNTKIAEKAKIDSKAINERYEANTYLRTVCGD